MALAVKCRCRIDLTPLAPPPPGAARLRWREAGTKAVLSFLKSRNCASADTIAVAADGPVDGGGGGGGSSTLWARDPELCEIGAGPRRGKKPGGGGGKFLKSPAGAGANPPGGGAKPGGGGGKPGGGNGAKPAGAGPERCGGGGAGKPGGGGGKGMFGNPGGGGGMPEMAGNPGGGGGGGGGGGRIGGCKDKGAA
ncbi:hypothetical protein B0F90DRAFT_1665185 [Multifurca ochricompacta]|uniref:Uncharacterized protein n=1 Tax=Multifurca ochricompacta TaxID=376703 RepID=A0AAD4QUP8_9AGAM|nr:hypothetical protein B0F90DRAFT_1665185 [Multifurca ochricompacta]